MGKAQTPLETEDTFIRNEYISFRVTHEQGVSIKEKAKSTGMSVSSFALRACLNKDVIVVDGLAEFGKQLSKVGTNLNQLVILCHQGVVKNPKIEETAKVVGEIWQLLNSLIKTSGAVKEDLKRSQE